MGSVVLAFRQQATKALPAAATAAQVQAALQALPTVGLVSVEVVTPGNADALCLPGGNQLLVTFLTVHGDLPPIRVATQNVDAFEVSEYRAGSKQDVACANRGLCDADTGLCSCFAGFGSSAGQGGPGSLRDCGYPLPLLSSQQVQQARQAAAEQQQLLQ